MSLLALYEVRARLDCSTKMIRCAGKEDVEMTPLENLDSLCHIEVGSLDSGSYLGGFSHRKTSSPWSKVRDCAVSNSSCDWLVVV